MRYKVFVSTEFACESYYCEREQQAHLLFNMATESNLFSYVELSKVIDECFLEKEWSKEDNDD